MNYKKMKQIFFNQYSLITNKTKMVTEVITED